MPGFAPQIFSIRYKLTGQILVLVLIMLPAMETVLASQQKMFSMIHKVLSYRALTVPVAVAGQVVPVRNVVSD